MTLSVSLSNLVAARTNPRRIKPEREAHRKLVASLRAYGLLEPLIVRPLDEGRYEVIAGVRRLAALRAIHGQDNPKVPCVLKRVDNDTARAIGLSENFAREPMHPLDEAEAFAKLASVDCKGVTEIACEFGVSHGYIRQRMKLAGLAEPIKGAYRVSSIDTATAEAFASVPVERQLQVWNEVGGRPEDAQHIRTIICEQWIDAGRALFDPATLPPSAVTSDLFAERVLIERSAFMEAQREALAGKRDTLTDEGWGEVVVTERAQVQDRLYRMDTAEPCYDEATTSRLAAIAERRERLEESEEDGGDEEAFDALDREEEQLVANAEPHYDEATKAHATVFLLLDPDGRVHTEYRLPRAISDGSAGEPRNKSEAPNSEQLSERQLAAVYTHEAIAVRQTVAGSPLTLKRLVVLTLHDRVRHDGIVVSHSANETTGYAERSEGFASTTYDTLTLLRREIDPLEGRQFVAETEAYQHLCSLSEGELDRLIEVLLVESLTGHTKRETPLIGLLRSELGVNIREHWRPDAVWLAGFQKCQLAHLVGELRGPAYGAAALRRKKSELVADLDKLFADAETGQLDDAEVAERVNRWVPVGLMETVGVEAVAAA